MTCEYCHRDCGVCTDCDVPHSKCLPCRGGAPSAHPPQRVQPQLARCATCGHTAAVHSLDGHCLLAERPGRPQLRALQMAPTAGWKHCACKEFKLAVTEASSSTAAPVTDDAEDEDAVDSEDVVDPSELDVQE